MKEISRLMFWLSKNEPLISNFPFIQSECLIRLNSMISLLENHDVEGVWEWFNIHFDNAVGNRFTDFFK